MDVHNEKTLWGKGNMRSRGGGMPSPIPPEVCALPGRVWVRDYRLSVSLLRGHKRLSTNRTEKLAEPSMSFVKRLRTKRYG